MLWVGLILYMKSLREKTVVPRRIKNSSFSITFRCKSAKSCCCLYFQPAVANSIDLMLARPQNHISQVPNINLCLSLSKRSIAIFQIFYTYRLLFLQRKKPDIHYLSQFFAFLQLVFHNAILSTIFLFFFTLCLRVYAIHLNLPSSTARDGISLYVWYKTLMRM